ncbi:MAG: septal ring lytic transglycosylase RlpA family protein [Pseudolabrys sp.]
MTRALVALRGEIANMASRAIMLAAGFRFAIITIFAAGLPTSALAQNGATFEGRAAYYSPGYRGKVASGEQYNPEKFTAAHKTLPFGTRLLVTDPKTRRSVVVTVNDRGPVSRKLAIDLSLAAARELKMIDRGIIAVKVAPAE